MAGITFTESAFETEECGKLFAHSLKNIPFTIALYGGLGAGKTTWVRGLIEGLGGNPKEVQSPTFVYLNIYETKIAPVYHFDLYRLKDISDFLEKGFEEYLDKDGITVLEWAERISSLLPDNVFPISLDHVHNQSRSIALGQRS